MPRYRKPELPRDQCTMWADRLDDALEADHTVRLIVELFETEPFIEAIRAFEAAECPGEGRPGFAPIYLAMLTVYGNMVGVRSSRQLEGMCINRVDAMWLMECQKPDHTTISRFLKRHESRMKDLLKASIHVAVASELITLKMVAIDGTFIEANAGRRSVRKKEDIEKELEAVESVVAQMMVEFQANDEREDRAAAADVLGRPDRTQSPKRREAVRQAKVARMKQAVEAMREREKAPRRSDLPDPKPIASTTDPDSRHMLDKEKRCKPNYNVQLAVDAEAGLIVGTSTSDAPNDMGQMLPMLKEVEANCGKAPEAAVFDAGYHTTRDVATAESLDVDVYVTDPKMRIYRKAAEARRILSEGGSLSLEQIASLPRDSQKRFESACFVYMESCDAFRCPAGQTLERSRRRTRHDRHGPIENYDYTTSDCSSCSLASQCTKSKTGRRVSRSAFDAARERMLARTITEDGKAKATQRASTVEPRFGDLKENKSIRRFLRRGLKGVEAEFTRAAVALNVQKLANHLRARKTATT